MMSRQPALLLHVLMLPVLLSSCGSEDETSSGTESFTPYEAAQKLDTQPTKPEEPPARLIQPKWLPMTGSEINSALSGQSLSIEEEYELAPALNPEVIFAGGCPPTEWFYADGTWVSHFCFRAPTTRTGQWTIEAFRGGEHLCVEAPSFRKTCRFVWQGKTPNLIFMPASVSSNLDRPTEFFNPYSLSPISGKR